MKYDTTFFYKLNTKVTWFNYNDRHFTLFRIIDKRIYYNLYLLYNHPVPWCFSQLTASSIEFNSALLSLLLSSSIIVVLSHRFFLTTSSSGVVWQATPMHNISINIMQYIFNLIITILLFFKPRAKMLSVCLCFLIEVSLNFYT